MESTLPETLAEQQQQQQRPRGVVWVCGVHLVDEQRAQAGLAPETGGGGILDAPALSPVAAGRAEGAR